MREIKFRGKRLDNGEWLYGYLIRLHGIPYIYPNPANNGWTSYEVDPDTVGQFTGLLDKNGKEIYEGDILIEPGIFNLPRTVFWDHRFMRFGNIPLSICGYIDLYDYNKTEVIGNIHDNPELLSNETNVEAKE